MKEKTGDMILFCDVFHQQTFENFNEHGPSIIKLSSKIFMKKNYGNSFLNYQESTISINCAFFHIQILYNCD